MFRRKFGYLLFSVFFIVSSLFLNTKAQYLGGNGSGYASAESSIDIPLPVELVNFQAKVFDNQVLLTWKTETEVDNYGFDIERQVSGRQSAVSNWAVIGFVEGHGNSNSPKEYSYEDKGPVGGSKFLYRLKQIDTDGSFKYSEVINVELEVGDFVLYQNYPNPFNPATRIRFNIKSATRVKLEVYNLIGEQVRVLIDGNMDEGTYEVEFNGRNLPSGVYAYRLEAGEFLEVRLMSLMK